MLYFLGMVCFTIAFGTVLFLIAMPKRKAQNYGLTLQQTIDKNRRLKNSKKPQQPKRNIRQSPTRENEKVSRAELRLSSLLFFDEKQARRLVDGVQSRFPDKNRNWCAEKALSDLERDRQMR